MPRGVYVHKPLSAEHKIKIGNSHRGMKRTKETRENIRKSLLGKKFSVERKNKLSEAHKGKKLSDEHKERIGLGNKGKKKPPRSKIHSKHIGEAMKKQYRNGRVSPFKKIWENNPNFLRGENNYRWIKDRTKLKDDDLDRKGQLHREWSKSVKIRDGWKCKINNGDCDGRIEAHHILSWHDFPEIRYEINNGISLCHHHHPKNRNDEKKLINYFNKLINVIKI